MSNEGYKDSIQRSLDAAFNIKFVPDPKLSNEAFERIGDNCERIIGGSFLGFEGLKHTEETKKLMSEGKKGNQWNKGRTHSAKTRRKMSEGKKGEKNHNYGKTPSDETKRLMSEANKGQIPWNKGKRMSDERQTS